MNDLDRQRGAKIEEVPTDHHTSLPAPDEATARPLADELHRLLDDVDNVRVLNDGGPQ